MLYLHFTFRGSEILMTEISSYGFEKQCLMYICTALHVIDIFILFTMMRRTFFLPLFSLVDCRKIPFANPA